jgi:hypothetical protein
MISEDELEEKLLELKDELQEVINQKASLE